MITIDVPETIQGTQIVKADLTKWIIAQLKKQKVKVFDLRYFGSRTKGTHRDDSDIDVFISAKKAPRPIFSLLYKHNQRNYIVELHAFEDFGDGFVPTYLGVDTENELKQN